MPEEPPDRPSMRALEPVERISEVLFGLIMVLTITGSFSVAGPWAIGIAMVGVGCLLVGITIALGG